MLALKHVTDGKIVVAVVRWSSAWKIYIEEGLLKTPAQLSYWDGKLRVNYGETTTLPGSPISRYLLARP